MSYFFFTFLYFFSFLVFTINTQNGFTINGINTNETIGSSFSTGDINGDGVDDILIGAASANPGQSYVIFGSNKSSFSSSFNLSSLNGSNGFTINRLARNDLAGNSVSIGDVNGDKFGDILIGAAYSNVSGFIKTGKSYVIFGKNTSFPSSFNLTDLNSTNGFIINGLVEHDHFGFSVSVGGDVNSDGFDDILICALFANTGGNTYTGQCYLIFGHNRPFSASFDLTSLNGSNGFTINGSANGDLLGYSVSNRGDVNSDGFDDILIGCYYCNSNAGGSYVIFGNNTLFPSLFDLTSLNGANGFSIIGSKPEDFAGYSVSLGGDINGDDYDDILIGAYAADINSIGGVGQCYVIFGKNTSSSIFPSPFHLSSLTKSDGFIINGIANNDFAGFSVSFGGDVNGDRYDDILIGAYGAIYNGKDDIGQSYLIFGRNTSFPASFELSSLNSSDGFTINGIDAADQLGSVVSVGGDLNGDGFDDIIMSAAFGSANGYKTFLGHSYVVFGRITPFPTIIDIANITDVIQLQTQGPNITIETDQHFSFNIDEEDIFTSVIGQPIDYTHSSTALPEWLVFSENNLKFEGQTNQTGTFQIRIVGNNWNGTVTCDFMLKVILKQRNITIPLDQTQSLSIQVPDPSGGTFHFEAQNINGTLLPSFILFDSTTLVLSLNSTIEIQPQTVFVTIIGKDDNGDEQVRYDYTLVFVGNTGASSDSDSVNIGAIVGGTLGGVFFLFLIAIVVVVVFLVWKRFRTRSPKPSVINL